MDNVVDNIKQAYIDYVLENHQVPSSVYILAKHAKMSEEDFYQYYSSLESLENAIWLGFFEETHRKIEAEEVYKRYSVREKMLAFYFTLLEVLKANRSYVLYTYRNRPRVNLIPTPYYLQDFRQAFLNFADSLVLEGRETQEIAERTSLVTNTYPRIFWNQLLFILRFWVNDNSTGFEKTDALIEKAVNFGFDAFGKTPLDSAFDLAKFVFQNR